MSDVERSAYRQPATPSGLESIEKGTLTWLDEDMYNNLNTGAVSYTHLTLPTIYSV